MSAFVFKKTPPSTVAPPVTTEDVKFFFDSNGQARVWQGGQSQPGFITGATEVTDEVILQALLRILVEGDNFSITQQGNQLVLSATNQSTGAVPVITAVPVVITAVAGQPLTFSPVQVVGTAPISTVYSVWINNVQQQSGITTGSYTVPLLNAGDSLFVRAVSTNAFGSDTEQSASVVIQTEQQAVQTYAVADYFVTNSDYNAPESTPTPSAGTYASGDYFVTGSDYNAPESQTSTTQMYSSEDYFVTNSDYAFA